MSRHTAPRWVWHVAYFLIFVGLGYVLAAAIATHP